MQNSSRPQAGFILRLAGKILLSRWVLSRVNNPDAERLLMTLAAEVDRRDIIDELQHRDLLRRTSF